MAVLCRTLVFSLKIPYPFVLIALAKQIKRGETFKTDREDRRIREGGSKRREEKKRHITSS